MLVVVASRLERGKSFVESFFICEYLRNLYSLLKSEAALELTSYPQVDWGRLGFPAVIGRRTGVESRVDATHSLENQGAGGDDDAPGHILGDRLALQEEQKSPG